MPLNQRDYDAVCPTLAVRVLPVRARKRAACTRARRAVPDSMWACASACEVLEVLADAPVRASAATSPAPPLSSSGLLSAVIGPAAAPQVRHTLVGPPGAVSTVAAEMLLWGHNFVCLHTKFPTDCMPICGLGGPLLVSLYPC